MDVVGDAIAAMRSGSPASARADVRAPWGLRFEPPSGIGFHVILRGTAWYVPPAGQPPVPLAAGDVVFVTHTQPYGLANDPATELTHAPAELLTDGPFRQPFGDGGGAQTTMLCGSYYLDQSRPHPLIASLPEVIHLASSVGMMSSVRAVVELLGAELDERRPGASAAVPALLELLLLYIVREHYNREAAERPHGWAGALADEGVARALNAIHDDPAKSWTVAELADQARLARATFARRFNTLVGEPPLAYLTWWRMTIAARMLRTNTDALSTVAAHVGYSSEFAFSKAFKRHFDESPGSYRRRGTELTMHRSNANASAVTTA